MEYAKIKDNELVLFPYTRYWLLTDNPDIQYNDRYDLLGWFNQTDAHLLEGYTLEEVVTVDIPVIDATAEHNLTADQPILVDGVWTRLITTVPLPSQDVAGLLPPGL